MAVESIAYVAETMVFLFLGIGVFTFEHQYSVTGIGTLILALINLNIARFLNISIVSWIVNKTRSEKSKINSKQ